MPASLARRVQPLVPSVQPGMLIASAIDLVLKEQEPYLLAGAYDAGAPERDANVNGTTRTSSHPPMDEAEARALTDRIRAATRDVCFLLLEAHERRAWSVLGYPTWEKYVRREFGLSRSRSYELLDQGRVLRAVKSAAGIDTTPDICAYAAGQIKFCLSEVTEAIRARTAKAGRERALAVIQEVVLQARLKRTARMARPQPAQAPPPAATTESERIDPFRLREAIRYLAHMPAAEDVVSEIGDRVDDVASDLEAALQWLTDFAHACMERRSVFIYRRHSRLAQAGQSTCSGLVQTRAGAAGNSDRI